MLDIGSAAGDGGDGIGVVPGIGRETGIGFIGVAETGADHDATRLRAIAVEVRKSTRFKLLRKIYEQLDECVFRAHPDLAFAIV